MCRMFLVNQIGLIRFPWRVINWEENLWAFRDNDVRVKDQGAWCVCSGEPNHLRFSGVPCLFFFFFLKIIISYFVSMFLKKYCIRAVKMASLHWRRGKTRYQVSVFKQARCYTALVGRYHYLPTGGKIFWTYQCQTGSLSHPMLAALLSCGHSM